MVVLTQLTSSLRRVMTALTHVVSVVKEIRVANVVSVVCSASPHARHISTSPHARHSSASLRVANLINIVKETRRCSSLDMSRATPRATRARPTTNNWSQIAGTKKPRPTFRLSGADKEKNYFFLVTALSSGFTNTLRPMLISPDAV